MTLLGQTFRAPADTAEWQIALARNGFSPGSIDGVYGSLTSSALIAYQTSKGIPESGDFDLISPAIVFIAAQNDGFSPLPL